jgi:hypothetical protein
MKYTYFVNVLQEGELDSDDEMERELEETEAAVDACIQKRAGVNGKEPEGAHVSETASVRR